MSSVLINKRAFWRELATNGSYETPAMGLSWRVRKWPFWRAVVYHVRVNLVVVRCGTLALFRLFNPVRWAEACHDMVKIAELCGGRITISGLEKLFGRQGPFVFVCNHMSSVETLQLAGITATFSDTTFIVKKSLMSYPFMGSLLKGMRAIAITRRDPREDLQCVLEEGAERLSRGISIIVFPQATRSDVFCRKKFTSIGAKLALRSKVPVIPVAVKTDFVENGTLIKDLGRVCPERPICYRFGPVLEVTGNGKAAHAKTIEFITGCLREWGGKIEDE